MNLPMIAQSLRRGEEITFVARGRSMQPRINDGTRVTVRPLREDDHVEKGEVVFARVSGSYYLHLVSAVQHDRVQISNNHGRVNGWTARRNVLGRLVEPLGAV